MKDKCLDRQINTIHIFCLKNRKKRFQGCLSEKSGINLIVILKGKNLYPEGSYSFEVKTLIFEVIALLHK